MTQKHEEMGGNDLMGQSKKQTQQRNYPQLRIPVNKKPPSVQINKLQNLFQNFKKDLK